MKGCKGVSLWSSVEQCDLLSAGQLYSQVISVRVVRSVALQINDVCQRKSVSCRDAQVGHDVALFDLQILSNLVTCSLSARTDVKLNSMLPHAPVQEKDAA